MKSRNSNLFAWAWLPIILLGVAITVTPAYADDNDQSGPGKLVGTWVNQVTVQDCQTGAVLRTFPSLFSYNLGGTMTGSNSAVPPSLRGPDLGKWEKTGAQTYMSTSLSFLFDATGAWTGTQKITLTIQVNGNNDAFTSTSEIFNSAGQLLLTGCATGAGNRM